MEKPNEMDRDFEFEKAVFYAMKAKGLLAPTTEKEVEDFEKNFGAIEVPLPEELEDPDSIIGSVMNDATYSDLQMNTAAFKDDNNNEPFDGQDLKDEKRLPHSGSGSE